jgi:hypothetical protein
MHLADGQLQLAERAVITDRNALAVWVEYALDQAGKRTILIVETNLQLDPAEIDFQPEQVEALCKDLKQHRQAIGYVDEVRLVRRWPQPKTETIEVTARLGNHAMKSSLKSI